MEEESNLAEIVEIDLGQMANKIESQTEEFLFKDKDFSVFYQNHVQMIRSVIFRICGEVDLDELTQETFLKIWQKKNQFKKQSSIKTWIYRIAVNLSYDQCRKRKKENFKKDGYQVQQNDLHKSTSFEKSVHNIQLVSKALAQLEVNHRIVVVLSVIEGLSDLEVSQVLNIPKGTVRSRLHYAKKDLFDQLIVLGANL